MDPYLAELSRTIDAAELGRRIRNARIAAGMTQAEVVAGDVTAAYLSRIETGHRRPEAVLLDRMAMRMGTTLEALLVESAQPPSEPPPPPSSQPLGALHSAELELALDHAELALLAGDGAAALEQADVLLGKIAAVEAPLLHRRATQVRAGALEAVGELNSAILVFEELTSRPTPDADWLKALIALSRCYRDSGDFHRAIAVGTKAAAAIEDFGIEGLTEAIQLTVTVSGAYHRLGDTGEAMRLCMRAIDAAEKYDSPIAKASAYWNASVTISATEGATPAALEMAKKAVVCFEVGEDNRNLAKLRAQIAHMHLAADPPEPEAALEALERAQVELEWSGASVFELALVHVTRARALLLLGEVAAASDSVRRGRDMAPEPSPFLRATASAIEGQIAVTEGRIEAAKSSYREAVHLLTAAGADRGAAQLWYELANLLTEVGDTEAALAAFRSAGASSGFKVALPMREQSQA